VHQIRLDLKAKNINDSWETIRTTLSTQMRTTVSLRGMLVPPQTRSYLPQNKFQKKTLKSDGYF
jgi:hypothetical protein